MGFYNEDGTPSCSYIKNSQNVSKKTPAPDGLHTDPLAASDRAQSVIFRVPVRPKSDRALLTWDMALLLFITIFGFASTIYKLNQLVTIPKHLHQEEVWRLQGEVNGLKEELSRLRSKLHPQAYSMGDFASESYGGQVITDLSSKTYHHMEEAAYGEGAPWLTHNTPRNVIKGQAYPLVPGQCWALQGQAGQLSISLARSIHITHVTIGHITKGQSPTGQIHSAPKRFSVYAQKVLNGPETRLRTFEYDDNGDSFQTFQILNQTQNEFKFVRLEIQSNYGSPKFTCLYNFRVHGRIPQVSNDNF